MAFKPFTIEEMQAQLNSATKRQTNIFSSLGSPSPKTTSRIESVKQTDGPVGTFKFEDLELNFKDFPDELRTIGPDTSSRQRNWRHLYDVLQGKSYLDFHDRRPLARFGSSEGEDSNNGAGIKTSTLANFHIVALELKVKGKYVALFLARPLLPKDYTEDLITRLQSRDRVMAILRSYRSRGFSENSFSWILVRPSYIFPK